MRVPSRARRGSAASPVARRVAVGFGVAVMLGWVIGVSSTGMAQTAQNVSRWSAARSGVAVGGNVAQVSAGPAADARLGAAAASQEGDDSLLVLQTAAVGTGDAVAGSTRPGLALGSNSSRLAASESGNAVGGNSATGTSGPSAQVTGGVASSTQTGDSSADVRQTTNVNSGDSGGAAVGPLASASLPSTPQVAVLVWGILIGAFGATVVRFPIGRLIPAAARGTAVVDAEPEYILPAELAEALGVPVFYGDAQRDSLQARWGTARHVDLADPHAAAPSPLEDGRSALVFVGGPRRRPVAIWAAK